MHGAERRSSDSSTGTEEPGLVTTFDLSPDRAALAAPLAITQLNSEAALGIPGRRFREWVRAEGVPHRRLGQLVIVLATDALAALRGQADRTEPTDRREALRRRAGVRLVTGGDR
jgi:hypothetical protein